MLPETSFAFHTRDRRTIPVIRPQLLLRIALWAILLAAVTYTNTDPDLWGHVRFGLDILRDGRIASADPYSFTSDRAWTNHEWLAEVLTAGAFRLAGNVGLIALKLATVVGTLLLLNATLRREGVDAALARDAAAAVAVILTMEQTHHVRPQLFSVFCFAVLLWALTFTGRGTRRWLLALAPLFGLWANLHGGWIVGGGVLLVWVVALAVSGAARQAAWCTAAGVACLAATLLTPHGLGLWGFLSSTVGFGRADIVEWQPIYALGWDVWLRWSVTLALALSGLAAAKRSDLRPERIAVVATLATASFAVTRLEAFFALTVVFLFGATLGDAYQRRRLRDTATPSTARRYALTVTALAALGAAAFLIVTNLARLHVDRRHTPEPEAVAFLGSQPRNARVLVWFDWGQYAIWHLPRGMRVSVDGRRETVYSDSLQQRHLRFYFAAPGGIDLPQELAADYVWIPTTLPAARQLASDDRWRRLYQGEQSVIFGRTAAAVANATVVMRTAGMRLRVFPGP
jgi:hypothetical protein